MQQEIILNMVRHEGNPNELISELHLRAWRWFLLPTGYVEFFTYRREPHVTLAFTNTLVWAAVLPGVAYTAWKAWGPGEGGREGMRFLVMMFLVSYLPLVTAGRPVFLLSSLSVLPFAFGCAGVMADGLLRGRPRWVWGALGAVVVGGCLLLYPMAVGRALDYGYTKAIAYKFGPHRNSSSASRLE
jgi:dolichyl-phosphate-mannose--protein O-mannosyl transferase